MSTSHGSTDELSAPEKTRSGITLIAVIVGGLAGLFPSLVIITSLPDIAAGLGAEVESLRWALTVPLLASALFLPAAGKLSDTFGHRRIFGIGLVAVFLGAVATALAWNAASFILFRTLTQVAGIAIQPAGVSLLNRGVSVEARARAFSWWALVVAAGPALGLGLGGPLIDATYWNSVFFVQGALAVASLLLTRLVVVGSRPPSSPGPFDLAGAVLLGLAALGIVLAIDQSVALGFGHVTAWIAGGVALVAGGLFWIVERRVPNPVVPTRLISDRIFTSAVAAQFFTQATSMGTVTIAPLMMRSQLGLSASQASYLLIVMPVAFAVAAPFGGRLASVRGHRQSAIVGTAALASGTVLVLIAALTASLSIVVIGLIGIGSGGGLSKPGYTLAVAGSGGNLDVGIAVASERMFVQMGSALGVATLLSLAVAGERGGFAMAALVSVGFSSVALMVALLFVGRRGNEAAHVAPSDSSRL